jgi:hypothetical protein
MKMFRNPSALSFSRSLLALLVLAVALVALAAGRALVVSSFAPAAPVYGPGDNPVPIAPADEASSAPAPALETAVPAGATALPTTASPRPAGPTAVPAATAEPAATAIPQATVRGDIHAIAPEPGLPGFNPPPGRE